MDKPVKRSPQHVVEQSGGGKGRRQLTLEPPVTVYEIDDRVIVEVEMPGVEKDKIEVTVGHDELTVVGWRKPEEEANAEVLHRERPQGCYRRSFILGESIDSSKIAAVYENGVLKLTLPKAEAAKPRKIAIAD
jgi:HSP20 family protein